MRATAWSVTGENTAPVGLFGLFSTMSFVLGVTAAAMVSGSRSKPVSSRVETITGTPSTSRTCSGYDTQYGLGTITSSPGSISATQML